MEKVDYQNEFKKLFTKNVKREGAAKMLEYLASTDFFDAPASTRFHGNFAGGLVEHCVKVFHRFYKLAEMEFGKKWVEDSANLETLTVIALLHDVCKTNCYKTEMRNVKVGNEWVKQPYYSYDDPLPYGHGEKSVYMICGYLKLSREEAMSINWHMGQFDSRCQSFPNPLQAAFTQYPIALLFHMADMMTSYLDEKTVK
jgi:hypothetical protein